MPLSPGQTTNELMAWGFRAIVAFATLVGLPVAGFMLSRTTATIDTVSENIGAHTVKLEHINDGVDYLTRTVGDHEMRIRQLERSTPR